MMKSNPRFDRALKLLLIGSSLRYGLRTERLRELVGDLADFRLIWRSAVTINSFKSLAMTSLPTPSSARPIFLSLKVCPSPTGRWPWLCTPGSFRLSTACR